MITIPQITEDLVQQSPLLEEALVQGIVNLSALARQLKPTIEQKLYKEVREGAIIMALKRLSERLETKISRIPLKIGDITVRSNLIEVAFANSPSLFSKQQQLLNYASQHSNQLVFFTEGVYETTLFASSSLEDKITKIFEGDKIRATFKNLSSVTLILPEELVYTPGAYYNILKLLAWEGINFIEVISSFTELTIFLEDKNVDRVFSILKKLS